MLSELGRRPIIGGGSDGSFDDNLEKEIGMLLREQRKQEADDRERELNIYRSGSAPPTVEGSLNAVGGLFVDNEFSDFATAGNGNGNVLGMSEEELRSDPSYLSYYYSNVNLNPRLPPPLLSKEDWRFAQRLQGGSSNVGGIGDRRKMNAAEANGPGRALRSMPPGFTSKKDDRDVELEKGLSSADWGKKDGLIGLPGIGLGSKQKSLAEICQDDLSHSNPPSRHSSRPASRNTFDENVDSLTSAEAELATLRRDGFSGQISSTVQKLGAPVPSYSYAAAVGGSLSRSTTPDPQLVPRTPSPCPNPIGGGRTGVSEKRNLISQNSFMDAAPMMNDSANLADALSGMNLSRNGSMDDELLKSSQVGSRSGEYMFNMHGNQEHVKHPYMKSESGHSFGIQSMSRQSTGRNGGFDSRNMHVEHSNALSNSYNRGSSMSSYTGGSLSPPYSPVEGTNYGLGGYSLNAATLPHMNLPPLLENVAAASAMGHGMDFRGMGGGLMSGQSLTGSPDSQSLGRIANQMNSNSLQGPYVDPLYLQYLRSAEYAAQLAVVGDQSPERGYSKQAYADSLQKAYLGSLLSPHKSQYGSPFGNKSSGSNHGYYGNNGFGVGMGYHGSPLASPVLPNSPMGPGSPMRQHDFNMRYPSSMRSLGGGVGPWNMDGGYPSSLLDEFKGNKTKCFELSEIAGHVVEFSADQYGSRFIQQKLENASIEEKNMVYQEINSHALVLMTDVFGNYVIQKFFEHGMPAQRRELARKLDGHVLSLSLQMYGCRVIQKAIEVVDIDQKIKMVKELDANVMRCVRDQNGNHVIQKCIECVPEEAIQFIVESFFNQVVDLSTHPYGCRVIQRVLEHCENPNTQNKVMDEIMASVSMLAQDQYGNYVVQHVLEHGKPHERSAIIKELAGRIVQMSQQKFASNVIEKCLIFGGPDEREIMVNEMLGTTDENEPLQAMMKDQFANYVVQKVLETCSDEQRELIMTRIKVHLNALKKYTYGKHIVARVEKLLAAGERRAAAAGMTAANPIPA